MNGVRLYLVFIFLVYLFWSGCPLYFNPYLPAVTPPLLGLLDLGNAKVGGQFSKNDFRRCYCLNILQRWLFLIDDVDS